MNLHRNSRILSHLLVGTLCCSQKFDLKSYRFGIYWSWSGLGETHKINCSAVNLFFLPTFKCYRSIRLMIDTFLFTKLTNRATAYILYIFLNIIKKIIQFDICKIVRRKSHFKWNCCTDFFCQLILVHNGLRQHFPEGVQNFVQWHFLKSNMAAATSLNH